MHEANSFLKSW